jgi:hypothetical protein
MTKAEATALGLRWKQRAYPISCEHLTLKSERNREGHATGKYICILCGEFFAAQAQQRSLVA